MKKPTLFLFFFLSFGLYSQTAISFRQLSVKNGLSQNSAISITQDNEGFLWIATQDGLNRYDGNDFVTYPFQYEDITKPNYSYLGKIYSFPNGSLWTIPIDKKLYFYDSKKNAFQQKTLPFALSSFLLDNQQTSWYGSFESGLYYQSKNSSKQIPITLPFSKTSTLFDIKQVSTQNIIVVGSGLVGKVDYKTKTFHSFLKNSTKVNYSSITEDKNGVIWIGSYGQGVWIKLPKEDFIHPLSTLFSTLGLPDQLNVQAVFADSQNRMWVATYGNGLYLITSDRKKATHFKHAKQNSRTIHYDDILSIYEDYSNTIWFGTDGGGLSYYDVFLEKFIPYMNSQTPESVKIDVVRAITKDQNNSLWIGTSGNGLTQLNIKTAEWKTFTKSSLKGLQSDRIMSLFSSENGDLWIGTQEGGLHLLHPNGKLTSCLAENPDYPQTIWHIFQDSKSRMWLATRDKGLVEVDQNGRFIKSYEQLSRSGSKTKCSIRTIREGGGYLWLGTDNDGLIRFDPKNPKTPKTLYYLNSQDENSISSNQIKSLYYQKESNFLWIGTNGKGLDLFDVTTQKFRNFSEKDGLSNDVIYGILNDASNNLWLSSNKGITKFSIPKDFSAKPTIINYSNYDGLATEFNTGAYYQSDSGELYFGNLEGFYEFTPQQIKSNTILPKTKITQLDVFNTTVSLSDSLQLSHKENTLTFHFASLQFSSPQQNQFKYKLLPHDENWITSGSIPFVRYTNLPPGSYTFEVVSANYDGNWSKKGDAFSFIILKPWYATNMAYLVYIMLFLLFIYWLFVFFRGRIQFKLKQKEAEQLKNINEYKSKLFSDLSHEIRTPLTLMSIPLEQQLANITNSDKVKSDLEAVSENKDRILKLVDQLQELTLVELDKYPLLVKEGDLQLLLSSLLHSYSYLAQEKGIQLTSSIEINNKAWFNDDIIYKILTNLLSNVIKYCPSGGLFQFSASLDLEFNLKIIVQNEVEKPIENPSQLFDRFYRENYAEEGSGIGLALAKELAELHKGSLTFDASQKNYAVFILQLPLHFSHYTEAEIDLTLPITEISSLPSDSGVSSILIVEDHRELRKVLMELFQPNFQVFESSNGKDGLEMAKKELPDIVISDIMMPEMDGFELCRELKTNELTSHIPVILLTAKTGDEAEWNGISEGADAYVRKPFRVDLLLLKVKKLLENRNLLRAKYKSDTIFKPTEFAVTSTEMKFMEKLQTVIDEKISDSAFDVTEFCDFMGMSRMQLHRKLKAITDQSTTDFMKTNRLKIADSLLLNSDLQIAEIAYLSGFNSSSYFIKSYKEVYQITPSDRKKPM